MYATQNTSAGESDVKRLSYLQEMLLRLRGEINDCTELTYKLEISGNSAHPIESQKATSNGDLKKASPEGTLGELSEEIDRLASLRLRLFDLVGHFEKVVG